VSPVVRLVVGLILVVVGCSSADAANRYDPRFRFRTITTPHFAIHFHQREESLARRLATIAEDVFARVSRQIGTPSGRVHVILVDQHDISNGWATPVPFNLIEISVAAPAGDSTIGNTDDWLRLVLAHEYTHIVHLDKARGWIGGLRNVFGRAPVLYPNLFLPLWQIEGIATYNESVLTGEGRVPTGDFRMIVDRAAAVRRFDPIDRANGGLIDWPGGSTQYAYGAYFHQYLAEFPVSREAQSDADGYERDCGGFDRPQGQRRSVAFPFARWRLEREQHLLPRFQLEHRGDDHLE